MYPLTVASKIKEISVDVFKVLINFMKNSPQKFEIDFNIFDSEQNTPMHYACLTGNYDLVQILNEECGADPFLTNIHLELPLKMCKPKSKEE